MCIACGPLMDALTGRVSTPSRRPFLKGGSATVLATGFDGAVSQFICSEAQAQTETGDTLYTGGPIKRHSARRPPYGERRRPKGLWSQRTRQ